MSENREITEKITTEEIEKIDILNLVAAFWNGVKKLWVLLALIVIICTLRSYFSTSFSYTPQYVASATVSVTTPGGGYTNTKSAQEMAAIFPYVLTSGVLQDVVVSDLGLDYLPGSINVKAEEDVNMITISVSSNDPQMAYNVLHSVIENYPQVAEYIFGQTSLQILDETGIPSDTQRETVIRGSYKRGAVQGIIISGVILCLYVFLKRTVHSKDQIKKRINIKDLGSLPYVRQKKRKKEENNNINLLNERIPPFYEETFRRLRIRVMRELEQRNGSVIMVTSSVPGEGKTTVAVNLAVALAKQGKSVILVDCDPRNPSVKAAMQNEENHEGIGAVLRGEIYIESALSKVQEENMDLRILYGGEPDNADAALLGSRKMGEIVKTLRRHADYVILDTAPAELLVDASLLVKHADSVLYVIRCDYTKMGRIKRGVEVLSMRNAKILGYVFNGDTNHKESRYGYGYGYGKYSSYGRYGHYGSYGRYGSYSRRGRLKDTGKTEDEYGRVLKE